MTPKSNRYFEVACKAGTFTFKTPSYAKLLPFFDKLGDSTKGLSELEQMIFMAKAIALFWAGSEPLDANDPMDSLQDYGCDLADITVISTAIFSRLNEEVALIGKAQETKN